eukprot:PhM_4_TR14399/c0_g1_i1/m.10217
MSDCNGPTGSTNREGVTTTTTTTTTTTAAAPTPTSEERNEIVFIVLQYGSHGRLEDFSRFKDAIVSSLPHTEGRRRVIVWGTDSFRRFRTDRGVKHCGTALALELISEMKNLLLGDTTAVLRMCCIGHSMGGLILRHALPQVMLEPALPHDRIDWVSFVTLASPHLGCAGLNAVLRAGAWLLGKVYSQAYWELMLNSNELTDLCSESCLMALRRFKHRDLYANVSDHLVPFATSSLMFRDPKEVAVRCHPEKQTDIYPHVRQAIALHPLVGSPHHHIREDDVAKHFSGFDEKSEIGSKVVQMQTSLRSVGVWTLHPVSFEDETWCVAHSAIINHSRYSFLGLSDAGRDIPLHVGKTLAIALSME